MFNTSEQFKALLLKRCFDVHHTTAIPDNLLNVRVGCCDFTHYFLRQVQERTLQVQCAHRLQHLDRPTFNLIGETLCAVQGYSKPVQVKPGIFLFRQVEKLVSRVLLKDEI